MNPSLMPNPQRRSVPESAWWALAHGETLGLVAGPGTRRLQVLEGRVWMTMDGTIQVPSTDIWLRAGDELVMPAFSRWVIEADCSTRFQLLVPPRASEGLPMLARVKAKFGWIGQAAAVHRAALS